MHCVTHLIPAGDDDYMPAIDADDLRERALTGWMTALARYAGHWFDMPCRFDLTDRFAYCWLPRYGVTECNRIVYVKGDYAMTYNMGNIENRTSYRLVHVSQIVLTDGQHADTVFGEPEPWLRRVDGDGTEFYERIAA
jgi:hypothetical protein